MRKVLEGDMLLVCFTLQFVWTCLQTSGAKVPSSECKAGRVFLLLLSQLGGWGK